MTWLPLLLADPSACLRWLVLRDLFNLPPDHPELSDLAALRLSDPLVEELVSLQEADGCWRHGSLAATRAGGSHVYTTTLGLLRLGYLGFGPGFLPVQRAAEYLFSQQRDDGSWPLAVDDGSQSAEPGEESLQGLDRVPLQTALPLRALAASGYAQDPRAERAYEWLLAQRLEDGAWPTGKASGVNRGVAGYRRLPHSRWGCRSNTTGALACLALHPTRRTSPPAQRGLDLLLGRETRERQALGYEVARILGGEPTHGLLTYFARFDLGLLLHLCSQVGVAPDDPRLAGLSAFIASAQGEFGLWEYPARPHLTRWVSFDLLRSLSRLDDRPGWLSSEPRTPFQPYPKRDRRF